MLRPSQIAEHFKGENELELHLKIQFLPRSKQSVWAIKINNLMLCVVKVLCYKLEGRWLDPS